MLRISDPEIDRHTVKLRLEGKITGPWVDELRRASVKFPGNGHQLTLDLTEVTYADPGGVVLLKQLQANSVVLTGCSAFLSEQLKR